MKLIKSVSGIRGIFNKTLFVDDIIAHAFAFSEIQKNPELPLLIARDSRVSGLEITESINIFLKKIKRNIIDCGIVPTPTAQLITDKFKIAGGIVITASHNPKEWNGMKFIDTDGSFLDKSKNQKLFQIAESFDKNNIIPESSKYSVSSFNESIDLHINNILNINFIDVDRIKRKKFKIVLDTINGATCEGFKKLLNKLDCEIVHINNKPNGLFPRNPEPKTDNIQGVKELVLKHSADLAFITDPDGDRLALIDNKGKVIIEENTLVLCVEDFLNKTQLKNPVITNLSTTAALDEVAKKYNCQVIRSAVGEINVVNEMKKHNAHIGGEGNGGVILTESHLGRDAFVGAVIILDLLASNKMTMHEVNQKIPKYYMRKEKVEINPQINNHAISNRIKQAFNECEFDETDGIKVLDKHSWLHVRQSNTEPIIRVYIESKQEEKLSEIFDKVKTIFNDN